MGQHINTKSTKRKVKEHDEGARRQRTSFKQYLRNLEESLLEEELEDDLDDLTGLNDE
jgi:hypothetical protein